MIDVTPLFTTDVPEFSAAARVRRAQFDASRSFVEQAVSFPENINVEVTQTYTTRPTTAAAAGAPAPAPAADAARAGAAGQRHASSCTTAWSSCPRSR